MLGVLIAVGDGKLYELWINRVAALKKAMSGLDWTQFDNSWY